MKSKPETVQAGLSGYILAAKLAPPKTHGVDLIERVGLAQRIKSALSLAATIVVAPAGYGKTTLLCLCYADLKASGETVAWLTLDDSDDDKLLFANHLVSSLIRSNPGISERLKVTPDYKVDLDLKSATIAILNAVEHSERRTILFIDDLHCVSDTDVRQSISQLVNSSSRYLHVVIGSRSVPAIRLAKLRAQGLIGEIGLEELKFNKHEAAMFLEQAMGSTLDTGQIESFYARTEGWPVGLRLIALTAGQGGIREYPQLLPGSAVAEFLRDEVFENLPQALAEFVADSGVLGEFSAELCDHVLDRSDSAERIGEIEGLQLFIMRVGEPGWFRFHQIFAESVAALVTRRDPARKAMLHQRAASWFCKRGYPARALKHSFAAGDPEATAQLLSKVAPKLIQSGREGTLLRYAAELPEELLIDYPELQLERAYTLTLTWQFGEAQRILRNVKAALTSGVSAARWAELGIDLERVLRKQVYCEMQLAILSDDMVKAEALAHQWLSMDGEYSYFEGAVSHTSLLYAQRERFNCQNLGSSGKARVIFVSHDNRWGTIWHDCIIGAGYVQLGQLAKAQSIFGGAFETAIDVVGRSNPTTAMPALHLAELALERGDAIEADALIEEFLPLSTRIGLVDQLIAGYYTKVRLAQMISAEAALGVIDEGAEIALSRDFDRLSQFLILDRLRILSGMGNIGEVRRVSIVNNLVTSGDLPVPGPGQASAVAGRVLAASYLAIAENRLSEVDMILRRWMRFLETHQFARLNIRFALQLAHAQILLGDPKACHRTLRSALHMGMQGGFLRIFSDANSAVRQQIEHMKLGLGTGAGELASYHERVIASFARPKVLASSRSVNLEELGGQYQALNDREAEILLMVAMGMMNAQIAEESGLTVGTVKWYLQQIYSKLGVNRRSEAVFKARQIGLIA
ncbi:helix-turn-helix transcriptional regulator [Sphingobium algorifonticola]|uniref:HTH luxR-type domain-containing protein n=1 Tax=Sphingobium algorifonticola TaxID=2008318 RepID=A0A437J3P7_9SPHN|nr:LuxR C-terminal-related transcriptional regulator [Sphingobium algorifonticola]RVT39157.1 hypothetical protein ENE74_16425 [Sphingobium algorifonticola]